MEKRKKERKKERKETKTEGKKGRMEGRKKKVTPNQTSVYCPLSRRSYAQLKAVSPVCDAVQADNRYKSYSGRRLRKVNRNEAKTNKDLAKQ
jgi:hypothetical protein